MCDYITTKVIDGEERRVDDKYGEGLYVADYYGPDGGHLGPDVDGVSMYYVDAHGKPLVRVKPESGYGWYAAGAALADGEEDDE